MNMTEVLTTAQLRRLTEHKYSSEGTSVTEPVMQKFWRWLVEQVPLWWSPNAMTLTGLIINAVSTSILIMYSPDARQEAPWWGYFLCAFGLFLYQALDAIDGKQARRTKSSSPLGELFDHGCDSVSIVFVVIGLSIAIQLGMNPTWLFFECFITMFIFYAAHWQTYCTGTLKFGRLDVTEAQFSVMAMYMVSAIFGPSFWSFEVPILGVPLKLITIAGSGLAAVLCCYMYFNIILMRGGIGKNGSTVAGTSVLTPIIPISIVIAMAFVIWKKSPSQVYENHPILYIISFGMAIAKTTNKLVVAHMTKSEMELLDSSFLGPGLLVVNQYFNTVIDEYYVLWACFVYCTFDLLRYSIHVCRQISTHLHIHIFKVTPALTESEDVVTTSPVTSSVTETTSVVYTRVTRSVANQAKQ